MKKIKSLFFRFKWKIIKYQSLLITWLMCMPVNTIISYAKPVYDGKNGTPKKSEVVKMIEQTSFISDGVRWILWKIALLLSWIIDAVFGSITKIITLDFSDNPEIKKWIGIGTGLAWVVLGLFAVFSLIKKQARNESPSETFKRTMISMGFIILLPTIFSVMNSAKSAAITDIQNSNAGFSIGENIMRSNLYDVKVSVYKNEKTNFTKDETGKVGIDLGTLNINDGANKDDKKDDAKQEESLSDKVYWVGKDGKAEGDKLGEFWGWYEYNYKYSPDFFAMYLGLIGMLIGMISLLFKIVKANFQSYAYIIWGGVVIATDSDGGKTSQFLNKASGVFLQLVASLWMIYLGMSLYQGIVAFNLDPFTFGMLSIGLGLFILDGADFFLQMLGFDAGQKDGFTAGKYMAMRGAGALGRTFKSKPVKSATNKTGKLAKSAGVTAKNAPANVLGSFQAKRDFKKENSSNYIPEMSPISSKNMNSPIREEAKRIINENNGQVPKGFGSKQQAKTLLDKQNQTSAYYGNIKAGQGTGETTNGFGISESVDDSGYRTTNTNTPQTPLNTVNKAVKNTKDQYNAAYNKAREKQQMKHIKKILKEEKKNVQKK